MRASILFKNMPPKHILITGGTGFIGRYLTESLIQSGHSVTVLSRHKKTNLSKAARIVLSLNEISADDPVDIVVNLAGATIFQRWSEKNRQIILNSRKSVTQSLIDWLKEQPKQPELFISASAVGYYGCDDDKVFIEGDEPITPDFTHTVCKQWEAIALQAQSLNIRTVILRFGIVLDPSGGALKKMLLPYQLGLGGPIGSGRQPFAWIGLDDLINVIHFVMTRVEMNGVVNAVSPEMITNKGFSQSLAQALHRPHFLFVPKWVLKLLFGEVADKLLINGQKVKPNVLINAGFIYQYPEINYLLRSFFK